MDQLTSTKLREIVTVLRADIIASECLVGIISGAALSYRFDSSLRPFPPMFIKDGEKDIEALRKAFKRLPKLSTISEDSTLDSESLSLLYWCVCCQPFKVRSGNKLAIPGADYLIELEPSPQQQRLFDDAKLSSEFPVFSAFHGTKLESVFSILNCGLLAHMNKVNVFGSGTYLTTERLVALNFTNSAAIWKNSSLGTHLRCIVVCEYVADHPDVRCTTNQRIARKKIKVPEKYILVKNNSAVQLKALILYSTRTPKRTSASQDLLRWWSYVKNNRLMLIVLIYVVGLVLLKLSKSKTARKIWSMVHANNIYH